MAISPVLVRNMHLTTIAATLAGAGITAAFTLPGASSGTNDNYRTAGYIGLGLVGLGLLGGIFAKQSVALLGKAAPLAITAAFAGGLGVLAGSAPAKVASQAHLAATR